MRSTANTVPEHTLGQEVVRKRKRVVRKTKVVRREKVARTVAARRARATTTGRARFEFFWRFPAISSKELKACGPLDWHGNEPDFLWEH